MTKPTNRRYRSEQTERLERQVGAVLDQATTQIMEGEFEAAITACQELLPRTVPRSYLRAELLNCIGSSQMMLQDFAGAHAAFSEALEIIPSDPYLWYNRGLTSRFTMRSGQSLIDFEQAMALEGAGEMAARYSEAATLARQIVQGHLAQHGPTFTLEQLIKQEELFQQAIEQMQQQQWPAAEQLLRQVLTLSDVPPQPWTNLGSCLMMQRRYDEAEIAYQAALERAPDNDNVRHNLQLLAHIRRTGEQPASQVYKSHAPMTKIGEDFPDRA